VFPRRSSEPTPKRAPTTMLSWLETDNDRTVDPPGENGQGTLRRTRPRGYSGRSIDTMRNSSSAAYRARYTAKAIGSGGRVLQSQGKKIRTGRDHAEELAQMGRRNVGDRALPNPSPGAAVEHRSESDGNSRTVAPLNGLRLSANALSFASVQLRHTVLIHLN